MVCLTSESGCGKRGKEEISGLFFSVSRTNRSGFKNTHNGRYQQRPPVIWNKRDIHPPDNRRLGKWEILEAERRDSLFFLPSFFFCSVVLITMQPQCCLFASSSLLPAVNGLQGGVFIHGDQHSATAVRPRGRDAQWAFKKKKKKALVPPHWLTHRCDVEST